jgi:perosamine synthetase
LIRRSLWRAQARARRLASRWRVAEQPVGSVLGRRELRAVERVLLSGKSLSWGQEVQAFERELKAAVGAAHAVATSSGTAALDLAAAILRLGTDDEVVVPAQTFRATVTPVLRRGCRLRFADCAPGGLNVDADSIERALTPQTRAVVLVHHGGHPAPLTGVRELLERRGVPLIEDCAHALGSWVGDEAVGAGQLCCLSFQSLKHVTTLGEGGALLTSREDWAEQARTLRRGGFVGPTAPRHGSLAEAPPPPSGVDDSSDDAWVRDYLDVEQVGTNARLSEVAAAVGRAQLTRLQDNVARRAAVAGAYSDALAPLDGMEPVLPAAGDRSSWHLYSAFVDPERIDRRRLLEELTRTHGVQIVLRYFPVHLLAPLRALGHAAGEAPRAESRFFDSLVQLPIHPAMSKRSVEHVVESLVLSVSRARR